MVENEEAGAELGSKEASFMSAQLISAGADRPQSLLSAHGQIRRRGEEGVGERERERGRRQMNPTDTAGGFPALVRMILCEDIGWT